MERRLEINLSLAVCLSAALHLFLLVLWVVPAWHLGVFSGGFSGSAKGRSAGRDIIVNINQDDVVKETVSTLLSDRDSSGRGFLTREMGDTFLNNSQEFSKPRKSSTDGSGGKNSLLRGSSSGSVSFIKSAQRALSPTGEENYPVSIELIHQVSSSSAEGGVAAVMGDWTRIPDKKGINMKNAIYISSDGSFSFNTLKFKNFEYFRRMKNKISQNWAHPMGNMYLQDRVNPRTGGYTPGYMRLDMIPSQEVKLYFIMNRSGDVMGVKVLESGGSEELINMCVNSITSSRTFGPVPDDIPGKEVVINFIFGYYNR